MEPLDKLKDLWTLGIRTFKLDLENCHDLWRYCQGRAKWRLRGRNSVVALRGALTWCDWSQVGRQLCLGGCRYSNSNSANSLTILGKSVRLACMPNFINRLSKRYWCNFFTSNASRDLIYQPRGKCAVLYPCIVGWPSECRFIIYHQSDDLNASIPAISTSGCSPTKATVQNED